MAEIQMHMVSNLSSVTSKLPTLKEETKQKDSQKKIFETLLQQFQFPNNKVVI